VDESVWFLDDVQFCALSAIVYRYLRRNPQRRRRRRKLRVSDLLKLFLLRTRQKPSQRLMAEMFGISQSAVARALCYICELICEALGRKIGDPDELERLLDKLLLDGEGQVTVLVDGTIIPLGSSAIDRENYSGKVRRVGKNLQVVSDTTGKLLTVSLPMPGTNHDVRALEDSGLKDKLLRKGLEPIGDKGYEGSGLRTPCKWYQHKPFTLWDWGQNRALNKTRNTVERVIAHLKVLAVLKTGIRTLAADRDRAIRNIIVSAVALFLFRQNWKLAHP